MTAARPTSLPYTKRPIQIDNLNSSSIAMHILATAKHVTAKDGSHQVYDYFMQRLWGAVTTWGRHFPKLVFVLGGNGTEEVSLGRHGHAVTLDNDTELQVNCRVTDATSRPQLVEHSMCDGFEVLRFMQCTNDYYGTRGPCCRCQESMRWILEHDPDIEWYAFSDDDVYFRGAALTAMLSGLSKPTPVAVSGGRNLRGFAPGLFTWLKRKGCDSENLCVFAFPWMQPALFNAAALRERYRPAIESNGLMRVCEAFRVTHDVGLGILNWMTQTPTIVLGHVYSGNVQRVRGGHKTSFAQLITIHGVRRRNGNVTIGGLKGWRNYFI